MMFPRTRERPGYRRIDTGDPDMLLDTIGIIVGFLTVVLLLSILVTAIVQTAANLMRRRHKALALGVAESKIVQTIESLRGQIDQDDANAAKLFDHVVTSI